MGSTYTDLVFNPIYYSKKKNKCKFFGSDFACVRDECRLWKSNLTRKQVKNILIKFGGTDHNNITIQILKIYNNLYIK